MLAPAMTLTIYFFVFEIVLENRMPNFVIFLFAGLLLWNLFQLGVLTATGVVVNNAGIVKKVSFPREILALAAVGRPGVLLLPVRRDGDLHGRPAARRRTWPTCRCSLLALVAGVVLASGLGILLSAVNVYLRDTQHLIEVVLTAWFWACPIVYPYQRPSTSKLGPHGLTWVYFLNPMTPLVLPSSAASMRTHSYAPSTAAHAIQVLPAHRATLWYVGPRSSVSSSSRWSSSSWPWPSSAASRATSPRSSER